MRTKNVLLNAISELLPYFIISIIGFIKVRVYIDSLGSEMNGYYQFINQIMIYLFLAEAGFGNALLYTLYKPVAEKNEKKISEIFNGSRKIFKKIGTIILILMIGMVFLLPAFVGINKNTVIIAISFLVITFANTIPFLFYSKSYTTILFADQKKYIYSIVVNIIKIVIDLLIIVGVIVFKNILVIALLLLVGKVIEEIILYIICSKQYDWIKETPVVEIEAAAMTKDVIFHKVGDMIVNNTDSVIIMAFLGPVSVSIYSTYNYILNFIKQLFAKINSGTSLVFGNIFNTENDTKRIELFKQYLSLNNFIALLFSSSFFLLMQSLINVWIKNPSYNLGIESIFIYSILIFLMLTVRPYATVIVSNGLFKQTKFIVVLVCILNIGATLILINYYGIIGAILGTIISYSISIILRIKIVHKFVFKDKERINLYRNFFVNIILFLILILCLSSVEKYIYINVNSLISFLLITILSLSVLTVILFLGFWILNKNYKTIIKKIFFTLRRKK